MENKDSKLIQGVGTYKKGKYKIKENGKTTKEFGAWRDMLRRCYNEKHQQNNLTYIGCSVCEEWLDFQVFAKWVKNNYYQLPNEIVQLDKDILIKNNKVYSPRNCLFVPRSINNLLILVDKKRGKYPLGVSYHKQHKKYGSNCHTDGKKIHLGYFSTPEEASNVYQAFKSKVIYETIKRYDNIIPVSVSRKLYKAWNDNYKTISNNIG